MEITEKYDVANYANKYFEEYVPEDSFERVYIMLKPRPR